MTRTVKLVLAGLAAIVVVAGLAFVSSERWWSPYLSADQPVTEEVLLARLTSEGWSDVKITRRGGRLDAVGKKNGDVIAVVVDIATGRRMYDDDYVF